MLKRSYRDRACLWCGSNFAPTGPRQDYCRPSCAIWPRVKRGRDDECWPWKGGKLSAGYGKLKFRQREYLVTRVLLEEKVGARLSSGEFALHTCDNPTCCNPAHLWRGKAADNTSDMLRKGRGRGGAKCVLRGENHPRAILSASAVADIKGRLEYGQRGIVTRIATEYGVSIGTICRIKAKKGWLEPQ